MSRFTVEFFLVGQANAHATNVTVCFFLTVGQTCTTYYSSSSVRSRWAMAPARFLIPGSIKISCIKLAAVIENSKLILPQLRGPSPCPRAQREGANVKLTFVPPRARVRSSAIRFIRNSIVQSVPNALFRCLPHSLRFIIVCLSGDRRSPLDCLRQSIAELRGRADMAERKNGRAKEV